MAVSKYQIGAAAVLTLALAGSLLGFAFERTTEQATNPTIISSAAEAPRALARRWKTSQQRARVIAPLAAARLVTQPPNTEPMDPTAATCPGLRLMDVETGSGTTQVWLTDSAGTETVDVGGAFRDQTVVGARAASDDAPAMAWLKGPAGICRTPTSTERLQAMVDTLHSLPPRLPKPELAKALLPALRSQASQTDTN